MPSIELMINQFNVANTQVLGVSVDSKESHENWAKSLGGISFPLLQDYHPRGAMSKKYGVFVEDKGYSARSTVIVDKKGIVQFARLAEGERDISDLLDECKKINI
jgi:alkyl hydroperoxide reductase subunit AhpC